jgi:GTP cyclohydrolase IA
MKPAAAGAPAGAGTEESAPASVRIRQRLQRAGKRFHANDNIAEYVDGAAELAELEKEVAAKLEGVLESLVIDLANDHNSRDTARRVAKMFIGEVFKGRYLPMPTITEFPNAEQLNELMIVGPITVRSSCSHHLVPILGRLWIGLLPGAQSNLIGLSKFARIADWVMSRPQIQEEGVIQLADLLEANLKPSGLALVLSADHLCMQWRGVKDASPQMTNSIMRGAFLTNPELRREFLQLMNRG